MIRVIKKKGVSSEFTLVVGLKGAWAEVGVSSEQVLGS